MITVIRKTLLHANSKNYLRKMCKNQTGGQKQKLKHWFSKQILTNSNETTQITRKLCYRKDYRAMRAI